MITHVFLFIIYSIAEKSLVFKNIFCQKNSVAEFENPISSRGGSDLRSIYCEQINLCISITENFL